MRSCKEPYMFLNKSNLNVRNPIELREKSEIIMTIWVGLRSSEKVNDPYNYWLIESQKVKHKIHMEMDSDYHGLVLNKTCISDVGRNDYLHWHHARKYYKDVGTRVAEMPFRRQFGGWRTKSSRSHGVLRGCWRERDNRLERAHKGLDETWRPNTVL